MNNRYKIFLTNLILISVIATAINQPFQIAATKNEKKLNNFDFNNLNLNFTNNDMSNDNETITIIASVNWSQWNKHLPNVKTTILNMNIIINPSRLSSNSAIGLFEFLNNYSLNLLQSHEPFYLYDINLMNTQLRGIWDHKDNRVVGGWISDFWRVNNFPATIDEIYLQSKTIISLDFVRINC